MEVRFKRARIGRRVNGRNSQRDAAKTKYAELGWWLSTRISTQKVKPRLGIFQSKMTEVGMMSRKWAGYAIDAPRAFISINELQPSTLAWARWLYHVVEGRFLMGIVSVRGVIRSSSHNEGLLIRISSRSRSPPGEERQVRTIVAQWLSPHPQCCATL